MRRKDEDAKAKPTRTYLVSEVNDSEVDYSAPAEALRATEGLRSRARRSPVRYLGGGGMIVAATDPDEAVKLVMMTTKRLGSYMVMECDLIDFSMNLADAAEAEGRSLRLNPGD